MTPPPEPSWRKPAGIFLMLIYLTVYAVVAARLAGSLGTLPTLVLVPLYLMLGLAWVLPLRPLLLWMNTGRWTQRKPAGPK
jgi:hypothetical protein